MNRLMITAATAALVLPAAAMATDLRMLTSYNMNATYTKEVAMRFIDMVEEASGGETSINLSGPDVIPPFEQLQPVGAGVFDILYTHGAYHTDTTGVGAAMDAVSVDPAKVREAGIWDLVDAHYADLGLKLIAVPPLGSSGFQYVLEEPIEGSPGLDGRRIRGSATYTNITEGLGGAPVLMSSGDVYSALDRGVIDGAAWGLNGVKDLGWHEVAGYFSKPTFGQTYTYILMNLSKFESLDQAEQALLLEQGRKLEETNAELLDGLAVQEWKELEELGMQPTEFAPEDAERLDALVNEGIWKLGMEKSPDTVARMRELAQENGLTE
ncbi:TRAP transporter substrate-binding protein DctP [Paracoccus homiensis]|uniref:TRAP-type mannitol/chloroaromatic compound transport system, substrate-binding protein n=1 Tax=Paracoccus homiensis TaxID=364199 RepID=A0A1I0D5H6_9RHOB|nr:TRAP transporter substrate-binding protein DctP [Paracoccus homiensis]SET27273.1 TRAP-type mannitol/chloroaromatic compound transport system, substrate-binding protein [Paracoccus homiensis]